MGPGGLQFIAHRWIEFTFFFLRLRLLVVLVLRTANKKLTNGIWFIVYTRD